jgi:tetratricopeptide (TPR) repeat protein
LIRARRAASILSVAKSSASKESHSERADSRASDAVESVIRASAWRECWLPFASIALLAFALRYVYLLEARSMPLFNALIMDGESYGPWSDRIAAGDWLGDQIFYQAPLYPYFLALVKLTIGKSLWTIRIVQMAIGSLSCGILFLAGRRYFSRGAGIAAGVILALYPPAIFFDGCIQKTNLGLLWTVLLLLALARAVEKPSFSRWLAAGVALGLLMLTREETLLLAPVVAVWILVARRSDPLPLKARFIGGWIAGLSIALLPVALRNHKVGGEFVLTTSQAGSNFYIGNNPNATGSYVPLRPGRSNVAYERQDAVELAEQAVGHPLKPSEVSHYWFGQAFAFIHDEPGKWMGLMLHKAYLLLNAYEMPDAEDQYFYERYCPLLAILDPFLNYGVVLPLAAAGIVLTRRRWREITILYTLLATLCAGVVIFYVFARYRYPLVPILVLFAGAAIVEAVARYRKSGFGALTGAALALVAGAALANPRAFDKDWQLWEQYSNSGIALTKLGRDAEAVDMFQKAIAIQPSKPELYGNLGISLQNLRRFDDAVAAFRRALELRPDDARAHARLGRALWLAKKTTDAMNEMQRAVNAAPTNAEYWGVYSRVLATAGQWKAAVEAQRKASQLAPRDVSAAIELAWLLATCPDAAARDGQSALAIAEELCRRTNNADAGALDALAAACAEVGRFPDAISTAEKALEVVARSQNPSAAPAIQARLAFYKQGKPYHQD